jgi:hypothetical protein
MSQSSPTSETTPPIQPDSGLAEASLAANSGASTRPPSFVKLAMRNMVRKRGKSLYHFTLTLVGLLAILVGLAYLTH